MRSERSYFFLGLLLLAACQTAEGFSVENNATDIVDSSEVSAAEAAEASANAQKLTEYAQKQAEDARRVANTLMILAESLEQEDLASHCEKPLANKLSGCPLESDNLTNDLPDHVLGAKLPADARPTPNYLIMTSPAHLRAEWLWNYDGIEYSLGVDRDLQVQFISTRSSQLHTQNGIHVGMTLDELSAIIDIQIRKKRGWGFVGPLPSGWNVFFTCGKSRTDCEPDGKNEVIMIFRSLDSHP